MNLSSRSLSRKVNYLLQTVNLSLSILIGQRTRVIYFLLKKAAQVNDKFHFTKKELKDIALLISQGDFHKKQIKVICFAILKLPYAKSSNWNDYQLPFFSIPDLLSFLT